ncbi:MAG: GAF domain-containing protein [Anaerolineales bacterium]
MINRDPSSVEPRAEQYAYDRWRERFLKVVLEGSCILGLIAIVFYLLTPSTAAVKLLAVLTYGVLVLVTFLTRLPYPIRAGVFLFLLFVAALSSLFDYGIANASILFVGFIVMSGLLFFPRTGMYTAIGVTLLSLLIFGQQGLSFLDWARTIGILIVVSTIIAIGLRSSQEEFVKTQQDAREMLDTLRNERSTLEQRIEERTVGLTQKTEQLRATSYIARKTAEVQDLATLLDTVARLITDQFGFYHTGIFLMNETGDRAVLQSASSEGGQRMIQSGFSLSVGTQGLVGHVAAQKKPRVALDVGPDAVFFNNPDLPMTRSELSLPLLVRNKVLGVLDIHSDKPQAFNVEDIDVLQALSDQVAIAIENARLMDETQAAIAQLETLSSVRTREAWSQKLRERDRVFTYTPLGLRAEKLVQENDKTISASIMLRGQKIGTIAIARKNDATWSKLDKDLIEEVAGQVGLAVDNIRLLEEATQRAKQEQTVGKLAARFSQSLDLDTLLQTAARELGQLPDISEVSVFIGQESDQTSQTKARAKQNTL